MDPEGAFDPTKKYFVNSLNPTQSDRDKIQLFSSDLKDPHNCKDFVLDLHSNPNKKQNYQLFFRDLSALYSIFSLKSNSQIPEVFNELKLAIEIFINGVHKYLNSPEFKLRNFIGDFAQNRNALAPELYEIVS